MRKKEKKDKLEESINNAFKIEEYNAFKIEETLDNLFKLKKSLISKKIDIRKELFEKFINSYECISVDDDYFLCQVSTLIKDNEYDNLKKKYQYLKSLIRYIEELEKI